LIRRRRQSCSSTGSRRPRRIWDFSPTWSVARALAAAGYVVYSYDRLGYANSRYFSEPGGGNTLITAAHRAELHQIVAGYPGEYYDVAAMIQADIDGSNAQRRPGTRHLLLRRAAGSRRTRTILTTSSSF
jgi:hypothetical protein